MEVVQSIGAYELLGSLGQGGNGTVYRARHSKTGELVALKTVRLTNASLLHSIRREIHALARLRHPQIVRILDEGLHEGLPWYAMELLEGNPLRRAFPRLSVATVSTWWIESIATSAEASPGLSSDSAACAPVASQVQAEPWRALEALQPILSLVHALCAPLAFLHGEGLVHRDLKPDNILLRTASTVPVLVDFGLASQFGGKVSRESLEHTGLITGTFSYMSPEQVRGELVDARSDLYSLGCILYELLCGRPPFQASNPRYLLSQHLGEVPAPPSQFQPLVFPELDALVLRLLSKKPNQRFGYASDVAAALERLGAVPLQEAAGPSPRDYVYRPSFSGRTEQLDLLEQELDQLQQGGRLLLLGGESGVGKTRLMMEFGKQARASGFRVLLAECAPPAVQDPEHLSAGAPLQALRQVLESIGDRCRERGPAETERLLGPRAALLAPYEPTLQGLSGLELHPAPVPLPPDAARFRLMTSLMETLSALCGEYGERPEPHLLLLDDLQWADSLSLDFLEHFLRSAAQKQVPLLILGSYRIEEVGPGLRKVLDLVTHHQASQLVLDRLSVGSVSTMVGDMLALSPPPAVFSRFLAQHSEGNPFFVAEYLRSAVAEKLFYRDASGTWCAGTDPEATTTEQTYERLALPRSVRELVHRRIQHLGPGALSLVQAAAVLGRESEFQTLAGLLQLDSMQSFEALSELLARQVLEEPEPGHLRFVHDKLREVAYDQIESRQKQHLHHQVAEALESLPETHRTQRLQELAQHWEKSGDLQKASERYLAAPLCL